MKGAILSLFATEIINPLVIALGHSLWQSGLAALILIAVFTKLGSHRPTARYAAALTALGISVTAFLLTFALLRTEPALPADIFTPAPIASAPAETAAPPAAPITISPLPTPTQANWEPIIFAIWLAGVTCFLLRTARSYHALGKLRRSAEPITSPALQKILATVQNQLGCLRPVVLLQCEKLGSPAVAGFLRPAIFLPAAMVTGCDEATLRAVLAHEIAHLRRHDYLVNLAQMVIEALFFFSPAIWWISHQLRNEREAACDQLAANTCGSPQTYATSLLAWVQSNSTTPQTALSAGGHDSSNLASRLRRLFGKSETHVSVPILLTSVTLALLGLLLVRATVHADEWKATIASVTKTIDSQETPPIPSNVTITGQVLDSRGQLIETGTNYDDYRFEIQMEGSHYHSVFEPSGKFRRNFEHTGSVSIYVWHRGYAPVTIESVDINDTLLTEGIDITLPDGFSYTIEISGSDGNPVPDAKVTYSLDGLSSRFAHSRTGATGSVVLKNLAGTHLDLVIDAPGFAQTIAQDISLAAGGSHQVTLEPAVPTTLSFISSESGEPIPNVQTKVKALRAQGQSNNGIDKFPALAGEDGVAFIEGLPENSLSWIAVIAEGFQNRVLPEISPGDTRTITLKTEPIAELKITIPKTVMAQYIGQTLTAKIAHWTKYDGFTTDVWDTEIPIPIESQIFTTSLPLAWERDWDVCISFRIQYPGAVANKSMNLPLPDDNGNISVTLPEYGGSLEDSYRDVVFQFNLPKDSQEIPVLDLKFTDARQASVTRRIPFINGEAHISIRAPASISGRSAILGLKHHTFDAEKLDVDIPAGDTPFIVDLGQAIPTGTLVVDLDLPDTVQLIKKPIRHFLSVQGFGKSGDRLTDDSLDFLPTDTNSTNFLINRIPLGSKYLVTFRQDNLLIQSARIKLSERKPIVSTKISSKDISDFKIQFPKGIPEDLNTSEIELFYSDKKWWHPSDGSRIPFSHRVVGSGTITFPNINWSLPGKYYLALNSRRNFIPFAKPINKNSTDTHSWFLPGNVAEGVLIDQATEKPIPGVRMRTRETYHNELAYFAESLTDDQGRFRFSNLTDSPVELSAFLDWNLKITLDNPGMLHKTGTGNPIEVGARLEKW